VTATAPFPLGAMATARFLPGKYADKFPSGKLSPWGEKAIILPP
jgi:hypothetical protein